MSALHSTMGRSTGLAVVVVALAQAGCDSGITTHDGGTSAVIRGSASDATGALAGVYIETTDYRYECGATVPEGTLTYGQTVSGPDGSFNLRLQAVLAGPGDYCVDLIATPNGGPPDTIRGIAVRFFEGQVLDTSSVLLSLN